MTTEFDLSSQFGQFILALIVSVLVLLIAKRKQFFSFPYGKEKPDHLPAFLHLLGAFAIYFFCGYFVASFLTKLFFADGYQASIVRVSWVSFITTGMILFLLMLFITGMPQEIKRSMWGRMISGRDVLTSLLTWVISFPLINCVGQLLVLFVYFVFHTYELPDQIAIRLMKLSFSSPLSFLLNGFSIIVFAPFTEEILFRGIVQNYLRKFFNGAGAIAGASVFFALLHYSSEQHLGNIPLLGSLFAFSCFLGFLYERQRSLWAPILLHAAFNTLSIACLYFVERV